MPGSRQSSRAETPDLADIDFSLIQLALRDRGPMIEQILTGLQYGSGEVRHLILEQSDFIMECRVCRNMFRALPNFIAHKRIYCRDVYTDQVDLIPRGPPIEETIIIQPQAPDVSLQEAFTNEEMNYVNSATDISHLSEKCQTEASSTVSPAAINIESEGGALETNSNEVASAKLTAPSPSPNGISPSNDITSELDTSKGASQVQSNGSAKKLRQKGKNFSRSKRRSKASKVNEKVDKAGAEVTDTTSSDLHAPSENKEASVQTAAVPSVDTPASENLLNVISQLKSDTFKGTSMEYKLYTRLAQKIENDKARCHTHTLQLKQIPGVSNVVTQTLLDVSEPLMELNVDKCEKQMIETQVSDGQSNDIMEVNSDVCNTENDKECSMNEVTSEDIVASDDAGKLTGHDEETTKINRPLTPVHSEGEKLDKSDDLFDEKDKDTGISAKQDECIANGVPLLDANSSEIESNMRSKRSKRRKALSTDFTNIVYKSSRSIRRSETGSNTTRKSSKKRYPQKEIESRDLLTVSSHESRSKNRKTKPADVMLPVKSTKFSREMVNNPNIDAEKLVCLICNFRFSSFRTLCYHMKTKHSSKRRYFTCPVCSGEFVHTWGVTRHLRLVHSYTRVQVEKIRKKLHQTSFIRVVDEDGDEIMMDKVASETTPQKDLDKVPNSKSKRTKQRKLSETMSEDISVVTGGMIASSTAKDIGKTRSAQGKGICKITKEMIEIENDKLAAVLQNQKAMDSQKQSNSASKPFNDDADMMQKTNIEASTTCENIDTEKTANPPIQKHILVTVHEGVHTRKSSQDRHVKPGSKELPGRREDILLEKTISDDTHGKVLERETRKQSKPKILSETDASKGKHMRTRSSDRTVVPASATTPVSSNNVASCCDIRDKVQQSNVETGKCADHVQSTKVNNSMTSPKSDGDMLSDISSLVDIDESVRTPEKRTATIKVTSPKQDVVFAPRRVLSGVKSGNKLSESLRISEEDPEVQQNVESLNNIVCQVDETTAVSNEGELGLSVCSDQDKIGQDGHTTMCDVEVGVHSVTKDGDDVVSQVSELSEPNSLSSREVGRNVERRLICNIDHDYNKDFEGTCEGQEIRTACDPGEVTRLHDTFIDHVDKLPDTDAESHVSSSVAKQKEKKGALRYFKTYSKYPPFEVTKNVSDCDMYHCVECDLAFQSASSLNMHVHERHSRKSFSQHGDDSLFSDSSEDDQITGNKKQKSAAQKLSTDFEGSADLQTGTAGIVEEIWVGKSAGKPAERLKSSRVYVVDSRFPRRNPVCQDSKKIDALIDDSNVKCLKCGESFASIPNLRRHVIRHLGWKRYQCGVCRYKCYNRSECKTHMTRTHRSTYTQSDVIDLNKEASRVRFQKKQQTLSARQMQMTLLSAMTEQRRTRKKSESSNKSDTLTKAIPKETKMASSKVKTPTAFNISTRNCPRQFDVTPYKPHLKVTPESGEDAGTENNHDKTGNKQPQIENTELQVESTEPQVESANVQMESADPHVESNELPMESAKLHVDSAEVQMESAEQHMDTTEIYVDSEKLKSSESQVVCAREQIEISELHMESAEPHV